MMPTRWRQKTCCTEDLRWNSDSLLNRQGSPLRVLAGEHLEKDAFGGFLLCTACDFHLSPCGPLSGTEKQTKTVN